MSEQHTPGPWKVVDSWDDYTIEGPNSEEIIFQDGPYGTPTIKKANAHLIAAAPEMLEFLQALNSMGGLGLDVHRQLDALIAKATGSTP
jgi:hypothetical protein